MILSNTSRVFRAFISAFFSVLLLAGAFFGSADSALAFLPKLGTLSVTTDASSPALKFVAGGATNETVGAFKFHASGEGVAIYQLMITANASPIGVQKVSVYDGATKVGEGIFAGPAASTTILFTRGVNVPLNSDKVVTIKADFSQIGTGQAVNHSGDFIQLNYGNAWGLGLESEASIGTSGSANVAGVRLVKSFPTVSLQPLASTTVQDGRLMRFAISADSHGSVGISQLAFSIDQNPIDSLSSASLYEFFDSVYSLPVNGAQGLLGSFVVYGSGGVNRIAINGVEIPAGQTRYFELRATVSASARTVKTTLLGDVGYMGISAYNPQTWGAAMAWSPNSTTTSSIFNVDWLDAFAVPGLPANGISFMRTGVTIPAPTCTLSAVKVTRLGKYTLSWTTTNTTAFSIEPLGATSLPLSGSLTTFVSEDTVFWGTAVGPGGTTVCSVFVAGPLIPEYKGITR